MIKCVDTSYANGNVDWDYLYSKGVRAAIIRAGYGSVVTQKDSQFERSYAACKRLGIKVGVYWYSYASTSSGALQEAETCLKCLAGKTFELPIYYDIEEPMHQSQSVCKVVIPAFLNRIESAGYFGGIYSSTSYFQSYIPTDVRQRYSIWVAHWVGTKLNDWTTRSCISPFKCPVWQFGSVMFNGHEIDTNYVDEAFVETVANFYNPKPKQEPEKQEPETPATDSPKQHTLTVILDGVEIFKQYF